MHKNQKVYKPLQPPKMQKANSMSIREVEQDKNINYDEDPENNRKTKASNKVTEVDYEKKNLERLQKIQEKKAQEITMMEEQRQKAHEEREKLKKIVRTNLISRYSKEQKNIVNFVNKGKKKKRSVRERKSRIRRPTLPRKRNLLLRVTSLRMRFLKI
jgi:hypothetical protein